MITHIFLDVDNTILDFNKAEAIASSIWHSGSFWSRESLQGNR